MGTLTKNELKAFKRVGYVGLLHRHKFYDIFLEIVLHILSFLNDGKRLLTDLDRKSGNSGTTDAEIEKSFFKRLDLFFTLKLH